VTGVEYEQGGEKKQVHGCVVVATGGFGADFAPEGLLAKYRPDLLKESTTNGDHCTGDGIKMAIDVGAETVDMDQVQVHPTGLVHPDEPDAKVKFLAAEALRGCGALILDKNGQRIANELGRRDYVTGRMWDNGTGPYRLVLNSKASGEIAWHCKHYKSRKIMKEFKTGADMAKEMGIPVETLQKTFADYNDIAERMTKEGDANKGPYDAYGGGKTYDPWGKKFFHNFPFDTADTFQVSIIQPCIHYCMGGIAINAKGEILGKADAVLPGLFGAGEVNGGIHGENRLGGSSLLDCVAFGRVAGRSASSYVLSNACGLSKL
jgi:succinate dehydrogenase/fumarate reductase flavoprotein subunit